MSPEAERLIKAVDKAITDAWLKEVLPSAVAHAIVSELGITPEMVMKERAMGKGHSGECESQFGRAVPCTTNPEECQCSREGRVLDALSALLEVAGEAP